MRQRQRGWRDYCRSHEIVEGGVGMVQLALLRDACARRDSKKGVRLKPTTFFKLHPDPEEIANP
ncbi:MAG TPA: hypothetical protein VIM92_03935 [Rhodanobacteraceae bacterium]